LEKEKEAHKNLVYPILFYKWIYHPL